MRQTLMECRTSLTSDPNQLVFREMKRKYNECDDTQQEAGLVYVCVSFSAVYFLFGVYIDIEEVLVMTNMSCFH